MERTENRHDHDAQSGHGLKALQAFGYGGPQLSERAQAAGVINVLRKPLARALHTGNV
jgi:hypothetical protein